MGLFSGNKSEVARLRAQIEDECEAMANMSDFAVSGAHEIIRQRTANIGAARNDLAKIVGENEATQTMGRAYKNAMEGGQR